ncbi:MAG: proteasome-type protease [Ilumatobacteraceae bacterium]
MTIGVGVQVHEGLVALADTHAAEGEHGSDTQRITTHEHDGYAFFVMTSGLPSACDTVTTRMEEDLAARDRPHVRLGELVTSLGHQLEAARIGDGPALQTDGPPIDRRVIVGGQLRDDDRPGLFLVSPDGNWVMATEDSPSFIIGRSAYGKPILDRLLAADTPLPRALALAYLAFDAAQSSVPDVEFPIDVLAFSEGGLRHRRFQPEDLADVHDAWHVQLRVAVTELPTAWTTPLWRPSDEREVDADRDPRSRP